METEQLKNKGSHLQVSRSYRCFHCPVSGCVYADGSEKYFVSKRLLNQHIAKVHAEKKYICGKCQKGFGLDWWRKYHEASCGKEWKCSCGVHYMSRESLLTHARRNQHTLPPHVRQAPKRPPPKNMKVQPLIIPVVVVIQSAIHQPSLPPVKPTIQTSNNTRPILPKCAPPVIVSMPTLVSETTTKNKSNNSANDKTQSDLSPCSPICMNNTESCNSSQESHNDFSDALRCLQTACASAQDKQTHKKAAAETQTYGDFIVSKAMESADLLTSRESRASQCSGRVRKQCVRIESTQTQTMESALIKMKKKSSGSRSRRNSVAITTDPEMLMEPISHADQCLWSNLDTIMFEGANSVCDPWSKLCKYSASTQTSPDASSSKVLCDSQTLTDDDLFQFSWTTDRPKDSKSDSAFKIITELSENSPNNLTENTEINQIPLLELFSSGTTSDLSFNSQNGSSCTRGNQTTIEELSEQNLSAKDQTDHSVLSSIFNNSLISETEQNEKNDPPLLSHIQTQTSSPLFDYSSVLANMETQTTDDFLFSDLEFLDTETQTPWDDFPNIDEALHADQLSIEIQTDFSSFDSNTDNDPYGFIMDMQMQAALQNNNKSSVGVIHTETQTQHKMKLPELTNTAAQTLDQVTHDIFY